MNKFKLETHYLKLYLEKTEKYDTRLNAFLAVTSSASIASWAIWREHALIWAIIIAVSQFIEAIKRFIPFENRLKHLRGGYRDLQEILNITEYNWYKVADGQKSNKEINKLIHKLRNKYNLISTIHFPETLPEDDELIQKSVSETENYFNTFYEAQ